MRTSTRLVMFASLLGLAACGQEPRTYEYFMAHPEEIVPVQQACRSDPSNPECAAADKADADIVSRRLSEEANRQEKEVRDQQESQGH